MVLYSQLFAGCCMLVAGFICARRAWQNRKVVKYVIMYVVLALLALSAGSYITAITFIALTKLGMTGLAL